jgi:RimJ/RimL family protein N-acetyltransferase
MHSFTTERLLIRPLAEQDKALYLSLYCDAKIMRNIGEPLSVEAAEKAFVSTIRAMDKSEPKVLTWAIVDKKTNEAIGLQALNWVTPPPYKINLQTFEYAEIGFMLLRQSNGKRIPKEAAGALINYAFNHLKLQRINTFYSSKNLTIAKLAQKLGFTYNPAKQPLDENQQLQYIERQNI